MPDIYADAFHQTAFGCFFILAEILIINVGRVQIHLCLCSFCNKKKSTLSTDVATEVVLSKKKFLKILQNSQEQTYARVSFLIKLQASGLQLY